MSSDHLPARFAEEFGMFQIMSLYSAGELTARAMRRHGEDPARVEQCMERVETAYDAGGGAELGAAIGALQEALRASRAPEIRDFADMITGR